MLWPTELPARPKTQRSQSNGARAAPKDPRPRSTAAEPPSYRPRVGLKRASLMQAALTTPAPRRCAAGPRSRRRDQHRTARTGSTSRPWAPSGSPSADRQASNRPCIAGSKKTTGPSSREDRFVCSGSVACEQSGPTFVDRCRSTIRPVDVSREMTSTVNTGRECVHDLGGDRSPVPSSLHDWPRQPSLRKSLRKEVIQPQVLLRLPCYDFVPVTSLAVGTPEMRRLRALPASMT